MWWYELHSFTVVGLLPTWSGLRKIVLHQHRGMYTHTHTGHSLPYCCLSLYYHSDTNHVSFNYPPTGEYIQAGMQESRSNAEHNVSSDLKQQHYLWCLQVVQRSNWESGTATPPMPHKRKKAKKEKKKDSMYAHKSLFYLTTLYNSAIVYQRRVRR